MDNGDFLEANLRRLFSAVSDIQPMEAYLISGSIMERIANPNTIEYFIAELVKDISQTHPKDHIIRKLEQLKVMDRSNIIVPKYFVDDAIDCIQHHMALVYQDVEKFSLFRRANDKKIEKHIEYINRLVAEGKHGSITMRDITNITKIIDPRLAHLIIFLTWDNFSIEHGDAYANYLCICGTKNLSLAIRYLAERISDARTDTREKTIKSLKKIGKPAIPYIFNNYYYEKEVRDSALTLLSTLGDIRDIYPIFRFLYTGSEFPYIVDAAESSFKYIQENGPHSATELSIEKIGMCWQKTLYEILTQGVDDAENGKIDILSYEDLWLEADKIHEDVYITDIARNDLDNIFKTIRHNRNNFYAKRYIREIKESCFTGWVIENKNENISSDATTLLQCNAIGTDSILLDIYYRSTTRKEVIRIIDNNSLWQDIVSNNFKV